MMFAPGSSLKSSALNFGVPVKSRSLMKPLVAVMPLSKMTAAFAAVPATSIDSATSILVTFFMTPPSSDAEGICRSPFFGDGEDYRRSGRLVNSFSGETHFCCGQLGRKAVGGRNVSGDFFAVLRVCRCNVRWIGSDVSGVFGKWDHKYPRCSR